MSSDSIDTNKNFDDICLEFEKFSLLVKLSPSGRVYSLFVSQDNIIFEKVARFINPDTAVLFMRVLMNKVPIKSDEMVQ